MLPSVMLRDYEELDLMMNSHTGSGVINFGVDADSKLAQGTDTNSRMKIRAKQMAKAYDYPVLQKTKPFNNPSTTRHLK